ncbi:MFS transporter [Bradyrhizobium sp. UFLA05-112]
MDSAARCPIALTSEYAPKRMRALLIAIMFCGFPLGSTIGGVISAPLIGALGWQAVFVVGGVLPLVTLIVLIIWLPESIRYLMTRNVADDRIAGLLVRLDPTISPSSSSRYVMHGSQTSGFPVTKLFGEGRASMTVLLWIAFFMNLLVMYFLVNWMPSLLKASGLPLNIAILSTAVLNAGGVVGAIVLGRFVDRLDPYLVLGGAYSASALFIAGIAFGSASVWTLMISTFLAGFGVVGAQIGMNALAASLYPTEIRATGVGWALGVGRGPHRLDHRSGRRWCSARLRVECAVRRSGGGSTGPVGGPCRDRASPTRAGAQAHAVGRDASSLTARQANVATSHHGANGRHGRAARLL